MSGITYLLVDNSSKHRTEVVNGQKFLVVPMTMIVPGVLNGSQGPLLYTAEENRRDPQAWNGVPIVDLHPTHNGAPVTGRDPRVMATKEVGRVYNAHNTPDGKVKAEGWINVEAANRVNPRIVERLQLGQALEISTGLFTTNIPGRGVYNGREYVGKATNYRPDHLAILVDRVGACSVRDGCGMLVNHTPSVNGATAPYLPYPTDNNPQTAYLHAIAKSLSANCGGRGGRPGPCPGWKGSVGRTTRSSTPRTTTSFGPTARVSTSKFSTAKAWLGIGGKIGPPGSGKRGLRKNFKKKNPVKATDPRNPGKARETSDPLRFFRGGGTNIPSAGGRSRALGDDEDSRKKVRGKGRGRGKARRSVRNEEGDNVSWLTTVANKMSPPTEVENDLAANCGGPGGTPGPCPGKGGKGKSKGGLGAAFTSGGAGTRSKGVASKASAAPAKKASPAAAAKKPREVKVSRAEMKAAKKLTAARDAAKKRGDHEGAAKATLKLKRIVAKAEARAAGSTQVGKGAVGRKLEARKKESDLKSAQDKRLAKEKKAQSKGYKDSETRRKDVITKREMARVARADRKAAAAKAAPKKDKLAEKNTEAKAQGYKDASDKKAKGRGFKDAGERKKATVALREKLHKDRAERKGASKAARETRSQGREVKAATKYVKAMQSAVAAGDTKKAAKIVQKMKKLKERAERRVKKATNNEAYAQHYHFSVGRVTFTANTRRHSYVLSNQRLARRYGVALGKVEALYNELDQTTDNTATSNASKSEEKKFAACISACNRERGGDDLPSEESGSVGGEAFAASLKGRNQGGSTPHEESGSVGGKSFAARNEAPTCNCGATCGCQACKAHHGDTSHDEAQAPQTAVAPAATATANALVCPKCGQTMSEKDTVCAQCGYEISDTVTTDNAMPKIIKDKVKRRRQREKAEEERKEGKVDNANPTQPRGDHGRWDRADRVAVRDAVRRMFGGKDLTPTPAMPKAPGAHDSPQPTSDPDQDAAADEAHSVHNFLAMVVKNMCKVGMRRRGMDNGKDKESAT